MSATASGTLLTVSDYLLLPEGGPRYQLVEGELIMAPSPLGAHQRAALRLARLLCEHVEKTRAGEIFIAPFDVYLDEHNVVQPDVLFISARRLPEIYHEEGVRGGPDLVVEVLSPRTARLDRDAKRRVYARAGVTEMWLVDPELRTVQVYRFAENAERPVAHLELGDLAETPLLPGLKLPLAMVFGTEK